MVHENMFNVEKHLNDTLHNPQAKGRSHTEREIVAASRVLGREPADGNKRQSLETDVKERGEALGDGGVLLQQRGLVVRVETSALPRAEKKTRKAPEPLDANNRGNMMARIQAGGTGGPAPSQASAAYLSGRRGSQEDDAPMLVLPEEMSFQGGWASAAGPALLGGQTLHTGEETDQEIGSLAHLLIGSVGAMITEVGGQAASRSKCRPQASSSEPSSSSSSDGGLRAVRDRKRTRIDGDRKKKKEKKEKKKKNKRKRQRESGGRYSDMEKRGRHKSKKKRHAQG